MTNADRRITMACVIVLVWTVSWAGDARLPAAEEKQAAEEIPAAVSATGGGLSVELKPLKKRYVVGEPVLVAVRIKGDPRTLWGFQPRTSVSFTATVRKVGKEGELEEMPRTRYGRRAFHGRPTKPLEFDFVGGFVNADRSEEFKYNLARRFDLTMPGVYEITATLTLFEQGSKTAETFRSTPLTLKVREVNKWGDKKKIIY